MNPKDLLFAETHEWVRVTQEGGRKVGSVGITAFAVHFRWAVLAATADRPFANDDHRSLYVEQAVLLSNLSWYLIIVGYGLLILAVWLFGSVMLAFLLNTGAKEGATARSPRS